MADDDVLDDEGAEEFYETFKKDLSLVDGFASLVLRGHYVLEREIDAAIGHIFFHPDYVLNDRLGFERKVRLVRAMSRNASNHSHWDLVLALNQLRNTIAHHGYDDRVARVEQIRQLCLQSTQLERHQRTHGSGDVELVLYAFSMGLGFLSHIEEDLRSLREEIEGLIAKHQRSA